MRASVVMSLLLVACGGGSVATPEQRPDGGAATGAAASPDAQCSLACARLSSCQSLPASSPWSTDCLTFCRSAPSGCGSCVVRNLGLGACDVATDVCSSVCGLSAPGGAGAGTSAGTSAGTLECAQSCVTVAACGSKLPCEQVCGSLSCIGCLASKGDDCALVSKCAACGFSQVGAAAPASSHQ